MTKCVKAVFARSMVAVAAIALTQVWAASGGASAQGAAHISANEMEGHCRIAAASQFATTPAYIMIGRPAPTDGGGMAIRGSVGGGDTADQDFTCNYNADGGFENISSE